MINKYKEYELNNVEFKISMSNHPGCKEFISEKELEKMYLFFNHFINFGDVVIDIGTHGGIETIIYSILVGNNGVVYGFEPNPYIFGDLLNNCKLNKHLNIAPIMKAATEEDGKYIFHYSDERYCNGGYMSKINGVGMCGHVYPLEVEGINISNWVVENIQDIEKISFIKIDTEGYDFFVLKSLLPIIDKVRPIIFSEIFLFLSIEMIREIILFFNNIDYIVLYIGSDSEDDYFIKNDKILQDPKKELKQITLTDANMIQNNMLQAKGSADILCIPKEKFDMEVI